MRSDAVHGYSRPERALEDRLSLPEIDDKTLADLKFSDALPHPLAVVALATGLPTAITPSPSLTEPVRSEH